MENINEEKEEFKNIINKSESTRGYIALNKHYMNILFKDNNWYVKHWCVNNHYDLDKMELDEDELIRNMVLAKKTEIKNKTNKWYNKLLKWLMK